MIYENIDAEILSLVLQRLAVPDTGRTNETIICQKCQLPRKLYINVKSGAWNCHKCGSHGKALSLYGFQVHGVDPSEYSGNGQLFKEHLAELRGDRGTDVPLPAPVKRVTKKQVDIAPIEVRHQAYSKLLDVLTLDEQDKQDLLKRGLSPAAIEHYKFRSLKKLDSYKIKNFLGEGLEMEGVPGFYSPGTHRWQLDERSEGILIPSFDHRRRIQGFQIRTNYKKAKYVYLTSAEKRGGCSSGSPTTFVGYAEETVYLTEGYLKAIIINHFLDRPVIAIPGVNARSGLPEVLDYMKKVGVRRVKILFDQDHKTNKNVKEALTVLKAMLSERGFDAEQLDWPTNDKGYDDYLLNAGKIPMREY